MTDPVDGCPAVPRSAPQTYLGKHGARAGRCGRRGHPVEQSVAAAHLEARAAARGWLHLRSQAVGALPRVDRRLRRGAVRGGPGGRRLQRRHRAEPGRPERRRPGTERSTRSPSPAPPQPGSRWPRPPSPTSTGSPSSWAASRPRSTSPTPTSTPPPTASSPASSPPPGQTCMAGSRLIVHESVRDELITRVVARAIRSSKATRPRPTPRWAQSPTSRCTRKGAGLPRRHPLRGGLTIASGGQPNAELGGLFVRPTVVLADPDSTIVREEVLGLVLAAYTFTDEDDAVRLRADFLVALCADIVAKRSAAGGGPATALRW
ncbi:MAG TPA: aldehyde dehydrogenase family protein [Jiangellales bacterium]|nr:aldehyde dehydrogenase family protein [Jiangellales bacterium]